ncbi:TonB-dependent receptor [Kineobactrum sediminis]|nr:TonB-dependent receptor [Kineobactrum sediminis]
MNKSKNKNWMWLTSLPLLALPGAASSQADTSTNGRVLEEVIVTVERRQQSLQDFEGTAVAFSGDQLKILGIQSLTDLSEQTPGVEISNKQGNVEVWIRGIGSSNNTELGDPAAATHLDGVYIPRPAGIGSVFFDIERVEVNVGPQGTLRGRNATAGSVNIVSWEPGLGVLDGTVEFEAGNYDQRMATGMINVPIGDTAAVRLAAYSLDHDSYYNDVGPLELGTAEAADNQGYRAQFLWQPNDNLRVLLAADYVSEEGTGYTGTNFANSLGNGIDPDDIEDPRDVVARGFEPVQDTEHWGVRLKVNYDLGFGEIEYLTSYRDLVYDYSAATPLAPDYPGVFSTLEPLNESLDNWSRFQFITDSESTIHELRFKSPDGERLYYTVGAFYFKEDQKAFLASAGDRGGFFQGAEFNQPDTDAESYSVYGDFTYELTPRSRLTSGLRFTHDEKSRVGVNARYAFALGGFDTNTGNPFGCCMGARVGTEGFEFAGFDRTVYDPDVDGSGEVSSQEFIDFYLDGISRFGERDTLDDIIANGALEGGAANPAACTDTDSTDSLICLEDGTHSFAVPISPDNSITQQDGSMSESFVDWRVRYGYDLSDDILLYGLVATGHKSGGFNDTFKDPEVGTNISPTYDTEKVTMYELGWKTEFDIGSVPARLNGSAFYYDYTDQVFTSILSVEQAIEFNSGQAADPADATPGALVVSFSFNAADSEIYGMQWDGQFQFPYNINLNWTALWLEAEIKDAEDIQDFRFQADVSPDEAVFRPISGNRLPHTPRYQFNAALSQFIATDWGSFDYVLSMGWRDDQFLTIFNSKDFMFPDDPRMRLDDRVEAYWTFDAGVGFTTKNEKLRLEAFVNNIEDEVATAAVIITQFDNTRFFTRPRTYGARLKYFF